MYRVIALIYNQTLRLNSFLYFVIKDKNDSNQIKKNKKKKVKDWSLNIKIMAMFLFATLSALLPTLLMYYVWLVLQVLWISILYFSFKLVKLVLNTFPLSSFILKI